MNLIILGVCCAALSLRLFILERNREKRSQDMDSDTEWARRFASLGLSLLKVIRKSLSKENHPVYLNGDDVEIFDLVEFVTPDGNAENGTVNFNIDPETERLDLKHPLVVFTRDENGQGRSFDINEITNIKLIKRI